MSSPIVSSRLTLIFLVLLMAGICTVSITDWSLPRATLIKGWGVGGEGKGRREGRGGEWVGRGRVGGKEGVGMGGEGRQHK